MLVKNTIRKIKKSLGRYLSLLLIVLIGVSFYAGIQQSIPQLRNVQNKYYKQTNLADYKIQSQLGLVDDDITALNQINQVKQAVGTYSKAVLNNDKAIMVHSIEKEVNGYRLLEGREPENKNECLADVQHYQVGDEIVVSETNQENDLNVNKFKVVGTIESPLYSGSDYGNVNIGDGVLYSFIFVDKQCFSYNVYTEIYLVLNKNEQQVSYSSSYKSLIQQTNQSIEKIQTKQEKSRYESIYNEANQKIIDSENELNNQIVKANQEFNQAQEQIDKSQIQLQQGQKELNEQKQKALLKIENAKKELNEKKQQLTDAKNSLQLQERNWQEQLPLLLEQKESLQQQKNNLQSNIDILQQQLEDDSIDENQKEQLRLLIEQLQSSILEIQQGIETIDQQVTLAQNQLQEAKRQIEDGLIAINEGEKTLSQQENQTMVQLSQVQKTIDEGWQELKAGQSALDKNKIEFVNKINDAKDKIQDGKNELAKIEKGQWYLFERDDFVNGYSVLETQCDKVSIIAKIIPLFFIAIVVLMTSNTMARMIVEERGEMGTLSSLGISHQQIVKNYMLYVLSSTSLGSIIGYFIGTIVIPPLVYICVPSILPPLEYVFDLGQLILVLIVSCFVMFMVTLVACQKELRQSPATLLRPVPPKNGKTILLERIHFIWKKLSFSWKITMRNIARYKKRVFITMVASASCTFIVLLGFAIKDSIQDVGKKQFQDIFQYENMVILDNPIDCLDNKLKELVDHHIKNPLLVNQSSMTVVDGNHSLSAYVMVPEDIHTFEDYFVLTDISSSKIFSLKDDGVIISRNIAEGFSLDVGDKMTFYDEDNHHYTLSISGVVDNYVSCYIYMSPALYQKTIQDDLTYNTVFGQNKGKPKRISQNLLENDNIISVQFASNLLKKANNGIEGLNNIVVLLVVVASLLDVTVLYNLTSINISERIREISTLKVLGFSDNESNQYIYRETMSVIIVGIMLGLILTKPLFNIIIDLLESEQMMFLRQIQMTSYFYATVITLFFAVVMQFVTYFKLKKIDMIESLKSVE